MGDIYSPRDICSAARLYFETDCCLSVLTWYDQVPNETVLFSTMPAGVIDFELAGGVSVEPYNMGDRLTFQPLRFEIFVEIEESDTQGWTADAQIWRLWWCLVNRLRGNKYWGKTVDGSRLIGGSVEGFPVESEETGIRCRFCWATCETHRIL